MKTYLKLLIGVAALVLATVCLQPARASGSLEAFGTTNSIDSGTAAITSWPVNGTSTNAISFTNGTTAVTFYPGLLTGKGLAIYNQEHLVLNVQGWLVNTGAACAVGIDLRSALTGGSGPAVSTTVPYLNTNGVPGTPLANDYESNARWFVVAIPASTTNWFNFQTNIVMDANGTAGNLPNGDFVGIRSITNSFEATCSLVNPAGVAFLNKKLIPTPLIGQ
jgi:hypothetical protein